ncbi:glutathione S-transferase [Infundibulicybe gibba]|nr:glutathione S-transferase [Infundibulicybe gibba]
MALKLYGSPISTCTKRVATVLYAKQIPFTFINIDLAHGEHKTPSFLEHQPFGQVPYIDDNGFILYESRAICRYLAAKYAAQGAPLVPTDPKELALFEQAVSIESENFHPSASGAVRENIIKPMKGGTSDPEVFKQHITMLAAKLTGYDAILGRQKYLAGDTLTLADLFHLPYGSMLKLAGSDIMESQPNVHRWFSEISSTPAWQKMVKDGVKSTA